MVSPLALRLGFRLGGWPLGRVLTIITTALSLLGGLAEPFAITEAGKRSAEDPLAYQAIRAGMPGEARPTAQQQAARATNAPAHKGHLVAPDA